MATPDAGRYQPSPEQLAFAASQYQPSTHTKKNNGSRGSFRAVLLLLFVGAVALGGWTYKTYVLDQASPSDTATGANTNTLTQEELDAILAATADIKPQGLPDPGVAAVEKLSVSLCATFKGSRPDEVEPSALNLWVASAVPGSYAEMYPGADLAAFETGEMLGYSQAVVTRAAVSVCG